MTFCVGCGDFLQRFIQTMQTGFVGTLPGISPYVALTLQGWAVASTGNALYEGANDQRLVATPELAYTGDARIAKVCKIVWGTLGLVAAVVGICSSLHKMGIIDIGRHAAAMGKVSVGCWMVSDLTMLAGCIYTLRQHWVNPQDPHDPPEWRTRARFITAMIFAHGLNLIAAGIFFKAPMSRAPLYLATTSMILQGGYNLYFACRQWTRPPQHAEPVMEPEDGAVGV